MNPIPVLGIPQFNRPDLLARCIESIDFPVETLIIINQGAPSDHAHTGDAGGLIVQFKRELIRERLINSKPFRDERETSHALGEVPECVKKVVIIKHPNAGVAGAWNEIVKLFPAPWHLISNNDIQFAPGDLEKMANEAWRQSLKHDGPAGTIYGNHGASWFVITRHGVETVGLFDENIFPAYLEDCDWSRRADLLGVKRMDVADVHAIHGDDKLKGSCTINSDPELRAKNGKTHAGNFSYYEAKWGGLNERETFDTPFNDPDWPVWAWKFDPSFRQRQQW